MIDRRDPELYGGISLNQLETRIYQWALELELIADCRQTNMEGLFVAWCHDALDWAGGVVVNPGAWTHYSYAIRDALEILDVPVVEVHLSNIEEREEWRRRSVLSDVVSERVIGKGPEGYRDALVYLSERQR
ncbi:MAG: type II 3-dehydroquinate dehydratase [Actinobacteria bacterium]|nr:MAG: type II 3-dehydroquinate dehydratase [Actinomycetota bacterium]